MSEEEDEVNNTLWGRVSVPISPTTSSQSRGHNTRLRMENQDTTLEATRVPWDG
jgi:hypothetical protein